MAPGPNGGWGVAWRRLGDGRWPFGGNGRWFGGAGVTGGNLGGIREHFGGVTEWRSPPPPPGMPDCGVHYLWFAFVCFLIRSPPPPPRVLVVFPFRRSHQVGFGEQSCACLRLRRALPHLL